MTMTTSVHGVLSDLRSRPRCALFACREREDTPCCSRCGDDLYDGFIHYGLLDPLFRAYWNVRRSVRRLFPRNCEVCGKRYWRGPKFVGDYVCSDECHDQWLPF